MSTRRAPSASSGPMSLTANQTVPSSDHRRVARALIIPAWHAMLTIQPADRASQGDQLADVVVLRAPVVEGGEPAAHVPHARGGAGDAGAQVQYVAEFLLDDPGVFVF